MGIAMLGLCSLVGLPRWVLSFIGSVSLDEEWERSSLCICFLVHGCSDVIEVVFVHIERM